MKLIDGSRTDLMRDDGVPGWS